MGVLEGKDYAIPTDIAGAEDHYGDMDFKVAGTREGITALQMDIKIGGITGQIMREAMEQARRGRLFLLDTMDAALNGARTEKSKYAPQIRTCKSQPTRSATSSGREAKPSAASSRPRRSRSTWTTRAA